MVLPTPLFARKAAASKSRFLSGMLIVVSLVISLRICLLLGIGTCRKGLVLRLHLAIVFSFGNRASPMHRITIESSSTIKLAGSAAYGETRFAYAKFFSYRVPRARCSVRSRTCDLRKNGGGAILRQKNFALLLRWHGSRLR